MVPTAWLVVDSIPLTASGKLDRVRVRQFVAGMAEGTARATLLDGTGADAENPASNAVKMIEQLLQQVWGEVLGLPTAEVSMARSFLNQRGDSITAMQLASRCRVKGIRVAVQDILRSQSLSRLAMHVGVITQSKVSRTEALDTPFDLSPIEELYLGLDENAVLTRFNHSLFVRLSRRKEIPDIARAVEALVSHHSMLRARFTKDDDAAGRWRQIVTTEVQRSFEFNVHAVPQEGGAAEALMASVIAKTQARVIRTP
jgi:aryl carrier-like protein